MNWSQKNFGYKDPGTEKFWLWKILVKKIKSKKKNGIRKILGQQNFWTNKFLGPKQIWPEKHLAPRKVLIQENFVSQINV